MRETCVVITLPNGTIIYMPRPEDGGCGEVCGKPAVDYQEMDGIKYWLCVNHWDYVAESTKKYDGRKVWLKSSYERKG